MQKIGFAEALDPIVATDNRYSRGAYVFLRDALDYTIKQQKKTKGNRMLDWGVPYQRMELVRRVMISTIECGWSVGQGPDGVAYEKCGDDFWIRLASREE